VGNDCEHGGWPDTPPFLNNITIMIAIARHINNITINPYEYILNDDGDAITFNTKEECIQFLDEHTDTLQSEEEWEDEGIYFVEFND